MKTPGMDAGDAIAAKGAVAPRVTLDAMKKRVTSEYYFTAGSAISNAGAPTGGPLDVLTICILVLDNGWTLLGKSAPASLENFDTDKGQHFAYEDALKQLWPLEGYLLREILWRDAKSSTFVGATPDVKIPPHDDLTAFIGTKVVNAKPMTRAVYCQLRGWDLFADENGIDPGYLVEYTDKLQIVPNVRGFRGYVSWSPTDVFEAAYSEFHTTTRQDVVERELDEPFEIAPEPEEPLGFDD